MIFSSNAARLAKAADKISRLRTELEAAELEHRRLRADEVIERMARIKGDTIRPRGYGGPAFGRADLERQARSPYISDRDIDRLEEMLAGHEASA